MKDLIKVNYDNDNPLVSARELYEFLEPKSRYNDWFNNMKKYGFIENIDFFTLTKNLVSGGRENDHQLSIEMAKEICMLQRNEKGKQARQYFIQLESMWNSPEMVMKRALEFANKQVETLQKKIDGDKPKVTFADAVSASHTSILVGELAKLLKQNGVNTGQNRLFQRLRDKKYLISRQGNDYNMPTQRSMELGLFEIKETAITHSDGHITVNKTVKVTGKGQQYFINRFLGKVM